MATEEYSVGYDAGYQAGWNEAMESLPPQRDSSATPCTWVGLTDEEKQKIMWVFTQPNGLFKHFKYMEAVEAKLREKNSL